MAFRASLTPAAAGPEKEVRKVEPDDSESGVQLTLGTTQADSSEWRFNPRRGVWCAVHGTDGPWG